jgi:two-component system response regulator AtoC
LARLFLQNSCKSLGLPVPELTAGALAALHDYSWPGNVRELKNVMERAPFVSDGGAITSLHIPSDEPDLQTDLLADDDQEETQVFVPSLRPSTGPSRELLVAETSAPDARTSVPPTLGAETGRRRILAALEQCAGNQTRAAKVLGVSRRTLVNHLGRLGVPRPKDG